MPPPCHSLQKEVNGEKNRYIRLLPAYKELKPLYGDYNVQIPDLFIFQSNFQKDRFCRDVEILMTVYCDTTFELFSYFCSLFHS
ncbi:hypothetical protein CferDRAFT_0974 [Chlorobium ferrooxidans DSM 13031]|uniref:Uncharacterized protein n=1 Tax=Chlorobium ferrooxidans DSM 13031 TaxID=377431 RepID=Q0YRN3_9CHLB|nr:hypothetical protein CferDRAFT_0974 [Chlorobium ferrooxidans DSM 13031]